MANTTTVTGNQIHIDTLDADWRLEDETPFNKIKLSNIQFNCDTIGDTMVIRNNTSNIVTNTAPIFDVTCVVADQAISKDYAGIWCVPMIDISDSTISGTSTVIITFE